MLLSDGVRVAVIPAADKNRANLAYLAPEEICDFSHKVSAELTNLWKIGMLLYEVAFACLPFPLEYLACCLRHKKKVSLRFPGGRSPQFASFIREVLAVNPEVRGKQHWRKRVENG